MLAIRCFDRFTSPGNTPDDPEAKIELYDKGKGEKALPRIKLRTKYFSLDPPSTGKPVVQLSSDTYGTTIFHTKREEDRAKLADMITRFIAGKHRPQPAGARPRPSRSGGPRPTVRSQRPQGPARQHGAAGGTPVGQSASGSAAVHPVHPGEQPGRQTLSPAPPQSAGSSSGSGSTTPVRRPTSPALSVSPTATRGAVSSTGSAAAASRTQRSPNKPPAATGRTATQRSSAPRTQTATANVVPAPRRQQQQQSSQAGPAMQGTQRQTALPTGPSMSPPLVASRGVVRQTTLRTPSGPADDSMGIKWAPAKDIANANANANATPFGDDFDGFDDDDDDDDFDDISDDDITTPDEEGASAMSPRGEARRVTLRKRASGADLATTEKLRGGSGPGASGVVMLDGMCANDGEEDMALNKTPDGYGVPTNIEEDNRRDPRLEHGRRPTLTKAKPGDAPYSNEKSATLQFYDKNDPLGLDDDGYGYPEGWDEIKARAKELGWDGEDEDTVASSPAASSTAPAAGGGPPPLVDYQPWVSPAGGQRASTLDGKSDTLLMGKSIAEKIRQEGAAMEAEAARIEREIANEFPSLLRGTTMEAAEKIVAAVEPARRAPSTPTPPPSATVQQQSKGEMLAEAKAIIKATQAAKRDAHARQRQTATGESDYISPFPAAAANSGTGSQATPARQTDATEADYITAEAANPGNWGDGFTAAETSYDLPAADGSRMDESGPTAADAAASPAQLKPAKARQTATTDAGYITVGESRSTIAAADLLPAKVSEPGPKMTPMSPRQQQYDVLDVTTGKWGKRDAPSGGQADDRLPKKLPAAPGGAPKGKRKSSRKMPTPPAGDRQMTRALQNHRRLQGGDGSPVGGTSPASSRRNYPATVPSTNLQGVTNGSSSDGPPLSPNTLVDMRLEALAAPSPRVLVLDRPDSATGFEDETSTDHEPTNYLDESNFLQSPAPGNPRRLSWVVDASTTGGISASTSPEAMPPPTFSAPEPPSSDSSETDGSETEI